MEKPTICNKCGGTDIMGKAWVSMNKMAVEDWVDGELAWCADCESECVALYPDDDAYGRAERRRELALKSEELSREFKLTFGVDGEWMVWGPDGLIDTFKHDSTALEFLKVQRNTALKELEQRLKDFEERLLVVRPFRETAQPHERIYREDG